MGDRLTSNGACTACYPKTDRASYLEACRDTPRQRARATGALTYNGKRCKRCGSSLRRVCNKKCIACDRTEKHAELSYFNAYHAWWRRARDPDRIRQRTWNATYRIRHALQLDQRAREKAAVRRNTINLLYGGT